MEPRFDFFVSGILEPGLEGTWSAVRERLLRQGLDASSWTRPLSGPFDLQVVGEAVSSTEFLQMLRDQFGLAVTPARREVTLLVVREA